MLFNRLSPQTLHGIYYQTSLLIWYSGDESHLNSKSFITSATLSASYLMAFASWGNGLAGHSSVQLMPSSLEMWESRHLLSLVLMIVVMMAAFLPFLIHSQAIINFFCPLPFCNSRFAGLLSNQSLLKCHKKIENDRIFPMKRSTLGCFYERAP